MCLHPASPAGEQALRAQLEAQPKGAPMLYCLPHMRMWTKLRPGVREFLEAAKDRQVGQVGCAREVKGCAPACPGFPPGGCRPAPAAGAGSVLTRRRPPFLSTQV